MKKFLLTLALLAGLALPARAATHYISPTGSEPWATSTDAAHPASLSAMNSNANPGDVVYVLPGSYSGEIRPANCTGNGPLLTIEGDISDPSAATFSGDINFAESGGSNEIRYVSVKGVKAGEVNLASTGGGSIPVCEYDSVSYCIGTGSIDLRDASNNVLVHNTLGDGVGFDEFSMDALYSPVTNNVIDYNTFNLHFDGSASQVKMWTFGGKYSVPLPISACEVAYNTINMVGETTLGSIDCHFRVLYDTQNCSFHDNHWYLTNKGINGQWVMRDDCTNNHFYRDTVEVTSASTRTTEFYLASSGSAAHVGSSQWDDCIFLMRDGWVHYYFTSNGNKFTGCTFVSNGHSAFALNTGTGVFDTLTVRHCTFVSLNYGGAAADFANSTHLQLHQNLAYSNGTGCILLYSTGGAPDSSLFFSPNGSPSMATQLSGGACTTVGATNVWGSPRFADSTSANFDGGLGVGSYGLGSAYADGYTGAQGTVTPDTERPAPISPLTATATSTSTIDVTFTAVGDDSLTGTASSYDLRYLTGASAFTENDWATATQVSGEPAPQAAGESESITVSGLAENTAYTFAIKATDNANQTSAISDSGAAWTYNIRPAPITITATAQDASHIQLSWTDVGSDSLTGTASSYTLKRSTSAITSGNFNSATTVSTGLFPQVAGTDRTYSDNGYSPGDLRWYSLKVTDAAGNISGFANSDSATTPSTADGVRPAPISDLRAFPRTTSSILLTWTAVGDDSLTGTATSYTIKRSTSNITSANFDAAQTLTGMSAPAVAGTAEQYIASGLTEGATYFFAIKVTDDAGNVSAVSDTAASPTKNIRPGPVSDLVATYNQVTQKIDLQWTNSGSDSTEGPDCSNGLAYYLTTGAVTDANVGSATLVSQLPVGAPNDVNGVSISEPTNPGVTYWYGLVFIDQVGNRSAVSNSDSASVPAATGDVTPPDAVSDLTATHKANSVVQLDWTAVGDDASTGTATTYDIRYRDGTAVTGANWAGANQLTTERPPQVAASAESLSVGGLAPGHTFWFAMKVSDEVPNVSAISNTDSVTVPSIVVTSTQHRGFLDWLWGIIR